MTEFEWAIEDIYASEKEFDADVKRAEELCDFSEFKGKLSDKKVFLDCMKKQERAGRIIEKLSVYAMMRFDTDTSSSEYDALNKKAEALAVKFGEQVAFVTPELISLDESVINGYIADRELKEYDYFLKQLLNEKAHVLGENEERLLALSSETLSSFHDIFTKIDNADLPLKSFRHGGKVYELSHGAYGVIMRNSDRKLREKCYKEYYGAYGSLLNTISATYSASVKKDVFLARARNYPSALEKALLSEDVSPVVYENLISGVKKALPLMHRYMKVKKKELGLKTMRMYDVYVPTASDYEIELTYDKAYDLVVDALSVFGDEYKNLLIKAKKERWLSVFETKNKRSGAYSVCVYDTHPFVLLNYKKTTHDVFTIAHEMGHSIHSYFSNKNQPYAKADYKIFVAEVASTVNETLLIKYLLKNAKDAKLKKYLLYYLLEMIRTTLFRQTQFAEFEEAVHSAAEKGIPLTKDYMSDLYGKLNEKYYGKAIKPDDLIKTEWARIPHFYRAFYVYKYATGIISALSISDRILNEGETAVNDYFKFLSSGGSDSPVELLKIAGVDLTKPDAFDSAFKVFKDALEEYEKL
ncbi:MAG: oligoendopeptidase F [Clostridia bacterium]|nr:oligoendopeptidase F [Clostridia bacterium]